MGEILAVVDENDNLIKGEERKIVHSSKQWHRGIHVFVYNKKKELIIQKRSAIKEKYPNRYDCSVSGNVPYKEEYETTAVREMDEELGIKNIEIIPVLHFRMPYGRKDYHVSKLFQCEYDGKIKPNEEISEIKFLKMGELKKIIIEKPENLTPWFVEMLKWHFNMNNKLHIFKIY